MKGIDRELEVLEVDDGYQLSHEELIVRLMDRGIKAVMGEVRYLTARSWTDANTLHNIAGISTVIFRPGELHHAHSAEELVRIKDGVICAKVLASAGGAFLRSGMRGLAS